MHWYNYVSISFFIIALLIVTVVTVNKKQYSKGKKGEIVSFLLLASTSSFVGIGITNLWSLAFYLLSFILGCIAFTLALKVFKKKV